MERRDHGQRGTARTRRKRACCASFPQTANAVTRLRAPYERRLLVGGHSWHVGARSCTEGERLFAGAVLFHMAWTDHSQRGMARARRKRACCASSPQTGLALLLAPRESRLLVGGHSWHVGARSCTEGERLLAGAVPFHRAWTDHGQRGMARARRKRACFVSSPQTANAAARLRAPRASRLLVGGHIWHVGARSCTEGERLFAGVVFFDGTWIANAYCSLEPSAGTSERGLAPREKGFSLVQCPSKGRGPTATSAARRARSKRACRSDRQVGAVASSPRAHVWFRHLRKKVIYRSGSGRLAGCQAVGTPLWYV